IGGTKGSTVTGRRDVEDINNSGKESGERCSTMTYLWHIYSDPPPSGSTSGFTPRGDRKAAAR
ncbi:hypothetical protein BC826DRAFT_1025372, partial [Russula brevipes]